MNTTIEIIEETDGWVAVNKPPSLSVHNAEADTNLLEILQDHLNCRLHAAHRLDSPTSGVLLLGKTAHHTHQLQQALATATKGYTAVLRGLVQPAEGRWSWSITNKGEGFRNPQGRKADQVPAHTTYQTIQSNPYLTMVHLTLETGRQHQIRKHAAIAKHAVVGDQRYGDRRYNAKLAQRFGFEQLCLCASRLEVFLDGTERIFEAPIPQEWTQFFT